MHRAERRPGLVGLRVDEDRGSASTERADDAEIEVVVGRARSVHRPALVDPERNRGLEEPRRRLDLPVGREIQIGRVEEQWDHDECREPFRPARSPAWSVSGRDQQHSLPEPGREERQHDEDPVEREQVQLDGDAEPHHQTDEADDQQHADWPQEPRHEQQEGRVTLEADDTHGRCAQESRVLEEGLAERPRPVGLRQRHLQRGVVCVPLRTGLGEPGGDVEEEELQEQGDARRGQHRCAVRRYSAAPRVDGPALSERQEEAPHEELTHKQVASVQQSRIAIVQREQEQPGGGGRDSREEPDEEQRRERRREEEQHDLQLRASAERVQRQGRKPRQERTRHDAGVGVVRTDERRAQPEVDEEQRPERDPEHGERPQVDRKHLGEPRTRAS